MNKEITYILAVMLATTSPAFAEKVYKHVNPDGTVSYSDQPKEGSEEITLPKIQTYTMPKSNSSFLEKDESQKSDSALAVDYKLTITQPENGFTITMGQQSLDVIVVVDPALSPSDRLQLFFDGQALGEPDVKTTFIITQLYRGTHTLQAKIVSKDKPGQFIKESPPVTFYVHRASTS